MVAVRRAEQTARYMPVSYTHLDVYKRQEYMRGQIGEEFVGVISGVTNFGLYVRCV